MRVLLVESDSAMARSIELFLRSDGFNVYTTDLGEEAIDLGKMYDYDIIILEFQLPDMPGVEVIKHLRQAKVPTPILVLARNELVEAKVQALNHGADDYMTKPFHKDELVARLRAIVRRAKGHACNVLTVGKIVLDPANKRVEVDGLMIDLPEKEYRLLRTLMLNKNSMRTREQLLADINGQGIFVEVRTLDVYLSRLRIKLLQVLREDYIETVRKTGYRFWDPEERAKRNAPA